MIRIKLIAFFAGRLGSAPTNKSHRKEDQSMHSGENHWHRKISVNNRQRKVSIIKHILWSRSLEEDLLTWLYVAEILEEDRLYVNIKETREMSSVEVHRLALERAALRATAVQWGTIRLIMMKERRRIGMFGRKDRD